MPVHCYYYALPFPLACQRIILPMPPVTGMQVDCYYYAIPLLLARHQMHALLNALAAYILCCFVRVWVVDGKGVGDGTRFFFPKCGDRFTNGDRFHKFFDSIFKCLGLSGYHF